MLLDDLDQGEPLPELHIGRLVLDTGSVESTRSGSGSGSATRMRSESGRFIDTAPLPDIPDGNAEHARPDAVLFSRP